MKIEDLVTKQDLFKFGESLLSKFTNLIKEEGYSHKKLLRSKDVREILSISPGTLQNLRIKGILPFTKVGDILYYKYEDILNLFEDINKEKS